MQRGGIDMKEKLYVINIFQNITAEELKKVVTIKVEKMIDFQMKKADLLK